MFEILRSFCKYTNYEIILNTTAKNIVYVINCIINLDCFLIVNVELIKCYETLIIELIMKFGLLQLIILKYSLKEIKSTQLRICRIIYVYFEYKFLKPLVSGKNKKNVELCFYKFMYKIIRAFQNIPFILIEKYGYMIFFDIFCGIYPFLRKVLFEFKHLSKKYKILKNTD